MSIVPASRLSSEDLALLGNNVYPPRRPKRFTPDERANRRVLGGVNRSLANLRERIDRLYPIMANAGPARRKMAS
jgi:hypothetical protein